jgi:hypothetical protein
MNIVPFQTGDTMGKRELVAERAAEEGAKHEGTRRMLYELEAAAATSGLPEVDCKLQHVFAPGAYARTIFIPAGTYIGGKIHKHQHLNILSQGTVDVLTEEGGVERLVGPLTMVSPPGTKRGVYAHTETVWTTVHVLPEGMTDIAEIEAYVIAPTFDDYEQFRLQGKTMNQIEVQS